MSMLAPTVAEQAYAVSRAQLVALLEESNRIEGINRVLTDEADAAERFLLLFAVSLSGLQDYLATTQPDAVLRDREGLNVRVGRYVAPPGGKKIAADLGKIINHVNRGTLHPYEAHVRYEMLHPFTDGNGRTGRLLWLWGMRSIGQWPTIGFLQTFYYQTLERSR